MAALLGWTVAVQPGRRKRRASHREPDICRRFAGSLPGFPMIREELAAAILPLRRLVRT
jgi:hypothetical protein